MSATTILRLPEHPPFTLTDREVIQAVAAVAAAQDTWTVEVINDPEFGEIVDISEVVPIGREARLWAIFREGDTYEVEDVNGDFSATTSCLRDAFAVVAGRLTVEVIEDAEVMALALRNAGAAVLDTAT